MSDRRLLGSLAGTPELDRWLALRGGRVVVRTGKAELGQGIRTAIVAVAADELGVDPGVIDVEGPATGQAPNELITAGSGSIEQSAMAVRQACAHARRALLARAADHLGVPAGELSSGDGSVRSADGREVSYWDLVGDAGFGVMIDDVVAAVRPEARRWTGVGLRRIDLPAKVRGEPVFVHDMAAVRHARIIRPGWAEHALDEPADPAGLAAAVQAELGVEVDVVVDGSFVAVVADHEGDAVLAAQIIGERLCWREAPSTPGRPADPDRMVAAVDSSTLVVDGATTDDDPGAPRAHADAATVVGPATRSRSSCTVPSARRAASRSSTEAGSRSGRTAKPSSSSRRRSARRSTCRSTRSPSGTSTAPAATGTTGPMTQRSTPPSWPSIVRVRRSRSSGRGATSTASSRRRRRW